MVVWLYEKDEQRISPLARELIESSDLLVSPMVLLEAEYLFETGRINARAAEVYDYLHDTIEFDVCTDLTARCAWLMMPSVGERAYVDDAIPQAPEDRAIPC